MGTVTWKCGGGSGSFLPLLFKSNLLSSPVIPLYKNLSLPYPKLSSEKFVLLILAQNMAVAVN